MVTQHRPAMNNPAREHTSTTQPQTPPSSYPTRPASLPISSSSASSFDSGSSNSSSSTSSSSQSSTSSNSTDSGEQTLNSNDSSGVYIHKGARLHRDIVASDDEDWSISENPKTSDPQVAEEGEPLVAVAYPIPSPLEAWLWDIRNHTEAESPTGMISKPLITSAGSHVVHSLNTQ